ncbi:MAG: sterol desaturase family protein [Pelagimonas sp.]|jgi:sterol desaturase/sphingolipid hydroxylase (fatty acid hydroxylase superfamily)|nr:sterol desaturase family protein [Pelagimonas sp.]
MDLLTSLGDIFGDFIDPKKRVFAGYLALSVVLALLWLVWADRMGARAALARIFDRRVLFSKSSFADAKIFVINRLISLVISPYLLSQLAIATALYFWLHGQSVIPHGGFDTLPVALIVALFSVTMFVVDDLSKYLVHRWMHRFPLLWAIHKVHHSATTMTPVTVYRVHPLEGVLYGLRSAVAQGSTLSLFYFLFGDAVSLYTVLGVNALVFFFHITGSNLRHSHIEIRYWRWLEHILISPAQHQLHHSIAKRHYDKNFGVALAVWDWLFGSLHLSEKEKSEPLEFGLEGRDGRYEADLKVIYFEPFREMGRILRRRARRGAGLFKRGKSHSPAE